jgi:hypothetical protein
MLQLKTFEKWLCAFVLIGAPLVGLLSALGGQEFGSLSEELAFITANNGRWVLSWFLGLPMGALMILAVFVLLLLVRKRAPLLGYLGAAVATVGLYFHGAVIGYALAEAPLVQSALPQDQVLTFVETLMYDHVAFTSLLVPFVGYFVGFVLLAGALWRARVAPIWIAALIALAPLTEFVSPLSVVSPDLMYLLLLAAFGYIALKLLRSARDVSVAAGYTLA